MKQFNNPLRQGWGNDILFYFYIDYSSNGMLRGKRLTGILCGSNFYAAEELENFYADA